MAGIIVKGDSLLLVRHQKGSESYWLLPGGGVDFGESLSNALCRELREEARLEIRVGVLKYVIDSIAPDGSRHIVNLCFNAEVDGGELGLGSDERVVEVRYVDAAELSGLTVYPDIREELVRGVKEGFDGPVEYLGPLWSSTH